MSSAKIIKCSIFEEIWDLTIFIIRVLFFQWKLPQFKEEQKYLNIRERNQLGEIVTTKIIGPKLRSKIFCVCVKRITLCNCLCSSSPSSPSRDFASVIQNIGKFGAKNYFTDHRTANTIYRFRDSVPVLKIHECYKDTQKFE